MGKKRSAKAYLTEVNTHIIQSTTRETKKEQPNKNWTKLYLSRELHSETEKTI